MQIQTRLALVNKNAVGAGPLRTRAGATRLGGAGTRRLREMAKSLVSEPSKMFLLNLLYGKGIKG